MLIEEVAKNIFRIQIPLPQSPLGNVNAYLIKGEDRDLLIDTGFCCAECRNAMKRQLKRLDSVADRRDVLLSHLHADHSGLAEEFAGKDGHIYISRVDLDLIKRVLDGGVYYFQSKRYGEEGFPPKEIREIEETSPARKMALKRIDFRFQGLKDGEEIMVGGYRIKALSVPGHTPGNMMFWMEDSGIMFTGDHVLFDISPNIVIWEELADALGMYMESLKRTKDIPVRLALPGHRETGNYSERVGAILSHHERRLEEIKEIIKDAPGLTAYEIAGRMKWRIRADSWDDFPVTQKWFATGECMAHLAHLQIQGHAKREQRDGLWHYYNV